MSRSRARFEAEAMVKIASKAIVKFKIKLAIRSVIAMEKASYWPSLSALPNTHSPSSVLPPSHPAYFPYLPV